MKIKPVLSSILRKLHLLNAAEYLRFLFHKFKYRQANAQFKKAHPSIVFPPDFLMYETYKLDLSEYYYDGKQAAGEIITAIGKYLDITQSGIKILDWGCGPGRIVRHLPELLPQATVYATDYNKKYVKWCSEKLKNIEISLNSIHPPLNYDSDFFDVAIGISIFTHLSAQNHVAWVDELWRIIKPGGCIYYYAR
jgi:2-polyprenyl-3-methyl-5-hydroxy-6-metoxy-1,4-benzoquinol methylase